MKICNKVNKSCPTNCTHKEPHDCTSIEPVRCGYPQSEAQYELAACVEMETV